MGVTQNKIIYLKISMYVSFKFSKQLDCGFHLKAFGWIFRDSLTI